MKRTTMMLVVAALTLGGCSTTYQLTLMPRNSGMLYYGTANDANTGQGAITVTIGSTVYTGSWLQVTPSTTTGYVGSVWGGGGGWRWGGGGGYVSMENPNGGRANALLRSADGSGLRCDFNGSSQGFGGGTCRDDTGLVYDVQIRSVPTENK